jgi:hypothetical protein
MLFQSFGQEEKALRTVLIEESVEKLNERQGRIDDGRAHADPP